MRVKTIESAKWTRCGGLRVRKGLLGCFVASALLFCTTVCEVRGQAPVAGEAAKSAAPSELPAGARETKSDEKPADAIAEQRKELAEDKARLLKLATELKNEIDKAGTVALSVGALRKVDEIEKLARSIRQAMDRDAGQAH